VDEVAEKVNSDCSGAQALTEKKGFIAAYKRCATQKRLFPQPLELVAFPKMFGMEFFSKAAEVLEEVKLHE
jgi:hypothetical protein